MLSLCLPVSRTQQTPPVVGLYPCWSPSGMQGCLPVPVPCGPSACPAASACPRSPCPPSPALPLYLPPNTQFFSRALSQFTLNLRDPFMGIHLSLCCTGSRREKTGPRPLVAPAPRTEPDWWQELSKHPMDDLRCLQDRRGRSAGVGVLTTVLPTLSSFSASNVWKTCTLEATPHPVLSLPS